jgi:hypothetical protein
VSRTLWLFFLQISNYPWILIWSCPIWHYPMCYHVFLPWNYLHYTLWSLDIHISRMWSLEIFSAMNSTCHFFHIYNLDFHLKKIFLPSNFENILWSNKFLKVPPCRNVLKKNRDNLFFLWNLELWILTTQSFHLHTLAYCRPIHLISIGFPNINNNLEIPPNKLFFFFNHYNLAIHAITLSEICFANYWDSKIQNLMVESRKRSFHYYLHLTCPWLHIWGLVFTKMVLKF